MGFIAMKALAGGLINHSAAAYAYMLQFDNVLPIWGIQRERELDEFLSYQEKEPVLEGGLAEAIRRDREELQGEFCRGCGYCMPCPAGIEISTCARMSLLIRRTAHRRGPGHDEENRGLPALRKMQQEMSLRAGHTGSAGTELCGLQGNTGREGIRIVFLPLRYQPLQRKSQIFQFPRDDLILQNFDCDLIFALLFIFKLYFSHSNSIRLKSKHCFLEAKFSPVIYF